MHDPPYITVPEPETDEQRALFADLYPDPDIAIVFLDTKLNAYEVLDGHRVGSRIARVRMRQIRNDKILSMLYDEWIWVTKIDPDLIDKDEKGFTLTYFRRDRKSVKRAS